MSFQSVVGQDHAKRILQNGLKNKSLSHAYVFSGPKGTGKRKLATLLAQALYCIRQDGDACGECMECRKVAHGNHPNFHLIEPDGASVKIEQIRDLQKKFAYRSVDDQAKVYVIQDADKMTVQAANSLLKFLEEPVANVIAILLTENGKSLLPTIQSRVQWVPFVPQDPRIMANVLIENGITPTLALSAVRLASGVEAALELARNEWFAEARSTMVQLAKETLTRFPAAMLTAQQKVLKGDLSDKLDTILDLWMLWLKDMIQLQCGRKEHIVFVDQLEWLLEKAFSRDVSYWVQAMDHVADTRKRLRYHANPQLAVEKLIMDMQGG
ncbi:MAG: DNA polymerase III subunit delta' [Gorillibacterium sp.]|nr:DNA polymerase III subunit delta' [Gorillibacterium sp.]